MAMKLDPFAAAPTYMKQWLDFSLAIGKGLEPSLSHLVHTRASRINAGAKWINIHTRV